MGKLEKTKIELDEREDYGKLFKVKPVYVGKAKATKKELEGKLFPKPKKVLTKSNFGATIQSNGVKKQISTKRVSGRKADVKNIKQGASQAPKVIAVTGLIAVFMAWIIDRYPSDLVPTIMAGMLSLVAAYVLLKNN